MKLIYKFTLWYLLISLGVFFVGVAISQQVLKREIDLEQQLFLRERLDNITKMIERRTPKEPFIRDKISAVPLEVGTPETEVVFSDTVVMHSTLERLESHTKLEVVSNIKGQPYKIIIFDLIVEEDDIAEGVMESMIKIYLLLMGAVLLLGISGGLFLFKPFNRTLSQIKDFKIDGAPITSEPTSTTEFKQLNTFLSQMTTKVQSDYNTLKEFSENASHEMQTPLANAIGKLELLLNEGNLGETQLNQIGSALNALKHLSKMGNSLGLLAKIDNQEFHNREFIDLSAQIDQSLQDFAELMLLRDIKLEQNIEPGVIVEMDPNLLRILINNLISNAIRHNQDGGRIRTKLDHKSFIICNTGAPLTQDPQVLFQRFKKDQPRPDGLGLGLAIVKKICDVNGFDISYSFEVGEHRLEVMLNKS